MKSIVLCERTLVQESENFSTLKEESNEKAEEKKIFNGGPECKKSESEADNFKKCGVTLQNGDRPSKTSTKEEDANESDGINRQPSMDTDENTSTNYFTSEEDAVGAIAKSGSCSDDDVTECSISEDKSSGNTVLENLEALNGSECVENPNLKRDMNSSVENTEIDNDPVEVKETEKSGESSQCIDATSPKKGFGAVEMEDRDVKITGIKEIVQPMEGIILDVDENKENEKGEKANSLEDYSGNDINKRSNECEIQVGEVQTISGAEKDSIWAENDFKKCEQSTRDKSEEKLMEECQETNEESTNAGGDEKEESHEAVGDETVISEAEESMEEGMHVELEESEQTEEMKIGEKENDVNDVEDFSPEKNEQDIKTGVDNKRNDAEGESVVSRKRQISVSGDEDPSAKKKRLLKDGDETNQVQSGEENTEDSSRCESVASLDTTNTSSEGQILSEAKLPTTNRTSTDEKNPKKLKPSVEKEESETKKQVTADAMLSVLEKFRGTLKTLTRSDLEELIVQKLCEVITERSNVGELRRKAQALEQDQERWKAKAQSLTKQMREMEMVMKKYMTEVQKQIKEGETNVVTPLKVTRSVGLQVSFYSSANKGSKQTLPQANPSGLQQNVNARNVKGPSPKLPSQFSPSSQNMRNKPAPPFQKGSPSLQKSPAPPQRRPIVPKPDYPSTPTSRPVVQQSHVNNPRGVPNQGQAPRPTFKPTAVATQQQPQSHQQQHQPQQQQNSSKVIDLTDDDDRQTGNVVVKTSGPIRVVNHLTQPPNTQNNRFAYLLPTTSTSTATSAGQGQRVLIATPTVQQPARQIMCPMPPLLFKGGNVVQSGSQTQMLNQSNKVILPKITRHPAPLPKRPIHQNTRPSLKLIPPRPALKISKVQTGIVLSWNMALSQEHAPIASYQLYAYQESDSPPATSLWKKVGDVKALPLPMACTLTQFMSGHKYHFAVRAVDLHSRIGPFSFPGTIVLV